MTDTQKCPFAGLIAVTIFALVLTISGTPANTIGYWRFEEGSANSVASGSGAILDSSSSADNGTPTGAPTYSADVPVNPVPQTGAANALSLQFAISPDAVVYSSSFPFNVLTDATIEWWMKVSTPHHGAVLWGLPGSDGVNRFHFYVNPDNTIGFDYFSPSSVLHVIFGTGQPFGGVPVTLQNWNHLAITKSANNYALYINGALAATQTDLSPDLPTSVGWSLSGRPCCPFLGALDEVRISNAVLSPGQFLLSGPSVTAVLIDIKPGSFPNSINPRSRGVVPVAILTTASFNADVDATTVRFGATGTEAAPTHASLEDVDGDGDQDMILHFQTGATGIQCGTVLAKLTGQTVGGQPIEGTDATSTVGCK